MQTATETRKIFTIHWVAPHSGSTVREIRAALVAAGHQREADKLFDRKQDVHTALKLKLEDALPCFKPGPLDETFKRRLECLRIPRDQNHYIKRDPNHVPLTPELTPGVLLPLKVMKEYLTQAAKAQASEMHPDTGYHLAPRGREVELVDASGDRIDAGAPQWNGTLRQLQEILQQHPEAAEMSICGRIDYQQGIGRDSNYEPGEYYSLDVWKKDRRGFKNGRPMQQGQF